MSKIKYLIDGIVKNNPTFVLVLGMCPTLATTTSAINGMGMGFATMAVLICSNIVIVKVNNDAVNVIWNYACRNFLNSTNVHSKCKLCHILIHTVTIFVFEKKHVGNC